MVRSGEPLTVTGPVIRLPTVSAARARARGSKRTAFATIAGIEASVAFWGLAAVFGLTALLAASQAALPEFR